MAKRFVDILDNPGPRGGRGSGSGGGGTARSIHMESVDAAKVRIRQIEYDRRLGGSKVDGKYPPHGELSRLRRFVKESK